MTIHFDCLPVELLDNIFQYLSNRDVIWSFSDISPYLNAVLNNYNCHRLNFKSISKIQFDYICNHLNVSRVISLTLSDDSKTPGQVRLFFDRFNLSDFINLHSLTILSVINEDIYPILSDLPKLKYLNTLITQCRSTQPLLLGQILNQLKSLRNLSVSYGDIFDHNVALPLRNLKILNAGLCNFLELRRLQMIVPSLTSLKISIQAHHQLQLLSDLDIWSSLERLNLTLYHETTITFNEIQRTLIRFHKLTHLILNIHGSASDLADGYRWETCSIIVRLCKFHFIMEFDEPLLDETGSIDQIFRSFSTPFWVDIKKWYVAVTKDKIYTISCYDDDDELFIHQNFPPLSTSPDHNWFYSKTKCIKLDKNMSSINLNKFHSLERLDLSQESTLLSLDDINKFIHLRHLIIHQTVSNKILVDILVHNPHINYLTISQNYFNDLVPMETIHRLHIQNTAKITNRKQIKQLSRIFPSVQRLFIPVRSRLIRQTINSFQKLENIIFEFQEKIKTISLEWLKENTRLNSHTCSFTCRSEPNRLLLWINNSTELSVPSENGQEQRFNSIEEQRSDKCSLQ